MKYYAYQDSRLKSIEEQVNQLNSYTNFLSYSSAQLRAQCSCGIFWKVKNCGKVAANFSGSCGRVAAYFIEVLVSCGRI